ncbi:MAG: transcriptional regulator [Acidimicrobiia bacterium]|nr:transcriptional regulator [Acidimicrobiia bacterium]
MTSADVTLLALHGLHLTGLAEAGAVAEVFGVDPGPIEVELKALADDGLVVRRDRPPRTGWLLTSEGRSEAARLVAAELDAAGARAAVRAWYERFLPLNRRLLEVCCRWQLRDPRANVLNDHRDPAYDHRVVAELVVLDADAQAFCAGLAGVLGRFGCYGPRLALALERVTMGATEYIDRPLIASYHTVWFELHEDLLATLGLDRAEETARLAPPHRD